MWGLWHRKLLKDTFGVWNALLLQGVAIPLSPPPQPNLKVSQYNQTYRWKVKSFSAMDFQYFHFISIFTTFLILSNKNAKINKNRTQYMLFVFLFITLYVYYGTISPIPGDKKAIQIRYVLNAILSDFSSLEHFCSRVLKK